VFKGIQKTTLIDFPGKVACTLFLPKCNFRCPFCHNRSLVFEEETGVTITEKEALEFLEERKEFLDGACITGGEPLLHKGLLEFCKMVKAKGLLVKVDTNGSMPGVLERLLHEKAVDFVSMDVKASPKNYALAAGVEVDLEKIGKSISLIRELALGYEFRMTVVPGIHSKEDFEAIAHWLKGSKKFFLQQFAPGEELVDQEFSKKRPFPAEKLREFAKILEGSIGSVEVRGI
jgi:anaerobic ribonucleoside-triphosphate reductase activating protein